METRIEADVAQVGRRRGSRPKYGGGESKQGRRASTVETKMTTAEYFQTPETLRPQELIYGHLRVAESPLIGHQRIVGELYKALDAHVRERRLGEVVLSPMDVILDAGEALIVQPDLLFVSASRSDIVRDRIWGAPDLVVEVLSPRPRIGELGERLRWFAKYGVAECWLVNEIERRVEVLQFESGAIRSRIQFGWRDPLNSGLLPFFQQSLDHIVGW